MVIPSLGLGFPVYINHRCPVTVSFSHGRLAAGPIATAQLGLSTIVDFERSRRSLSAETVAAIRAALEAAGVIFVAENGEGPGVRLRKLGPVT